MDYEYDQIVLKIRKIDRKYLKKCSLYLAIREIQMKTTLIFNLISFELFVRGVQETLQTTHSISATLSCHPCILWWPLLRSWLSP